MKNLRKGRKFGRETDQRRALLNGLASSFFLHGKIGTTEAKAKEARILIEKFITRAKKPTIANRRILAKSFSADAVKKAVEVAEKMKNRPGGYTRVIKVSPRKRDGARMAILELVQ